MASKTNRPTGDLPAARTVLPVTRYPDRMEDYSKERLAEFLLNNAVSAADYAAALEEVRKLGIDPATVPHEPPPAA
jgi:hypothetical protein